MATNEEILAILLQIQAQGLAEADAVNQVLQNTGTTAGGAAAQVSQLTTAHEEHASALQTLSGYQVTYGEQLTKEEQHYANLQLSSKEFAAAERDIGRDANAAARAMGALGEDGARAFDRISALGSVMGSGGALGIGIGAALVGGGAVIEMSKSMIDNADKNEKAQKNLSQAWESQGKDLVYAQGAIDSFIDKNSKFISDQYDVKDAFAAATRAGFDWNTTLRLVNDALDLSAINGRTVSQNVDTLIRAHSGDARALKDLGINSKELEDPTKLLTKAHQEQTKATDEHSKAQRTLAEWEAAHHDRSKLTQADLMREQDLKDKVTKSTKDLTTANNDVAAATAAVKDKGDKYNELLDLLEGKVKGARNDTTELKQSQNDLGNTWAKLSNDNGPQLEAMLAGAIQGVDNFLNMLRNSGPVWDFIDTQLMNVIGSIKGWIEGWKEAYDAYNNFIESITGSDPTKGQKNIRPAGHAPGRRAGGGSVDPFGVYEIGEEGPETLVMGASGGFVIPNSGGGSDSDEEQTELLRQAVAYLSALARKPVARISVNAASSPSNNRALLSPA